MFINFIYSPLTIFIVMYTTTFLTYRDTSYELTKYLSTKENIQDAYE